MINMILRCRFYFVLIIFYGVLFCGCVTTDSGWHSKSVVSHTKAAPEVKARAIAVVDKLDVAADEKQPDVRFATQIVTANRPFRFSPDGKLLITLGEFDYKKYGISELQLWETATRRLLRTFPMERGSICDVVIGPGNRYIMINAGSFVRLLELSTFKTVATIGPHKDWLGFAGIDFTPDGRHILISHKRSQNGARVYNIATGKEIARFRSQGRRSAFAPDGRLLVQTGGPRTIEGEFRLSWFDYLSGRSLGDIDVPGIMRVGSKHIKISRDGRFVVRDLFNVIHVNGNKRSRPENLVEIIDLKARRTHHIPMDRIGALDVQIGSDSRHCFILLEHNVLQMVDMTTGSLIREYKSELRYYRALKFAVSPTEPIIALYERPYQLVIGESRYQPDSSLQSPHRKIRLINFETWQPQRPIIGINADMFKKGFPPYFLSDRKAFTGDGKVLQLDSGEIVPLTDDLQPHLRHYHVWPDGHYLQYPPTGENKWYPAGPYVFSEDGRQVMRTFRKIIVRNWWSSIQGRICVWDNETGELRSKIDLDSLDSIFGYGFSPDNQFLAICIAEEKPTYKGGLGIMLWHDVETKHKEWRIEIWDIKQKERVRSIDRLAVPADAVTFGPDGRTLFYGGVNGWVYARDIDSGKLLNHYYAGSGITGITISRDGTRMLVNGDALSYWDLKQAKHLFSHVGGNYLKDNDFGYLTWIPDGYYRGSDDMARQICHLIRGLETFSVDQFFEQFYNPAMVEARTRGLETGSINIGQVLNASPPPRVHMLPPKLRTGGKAEIKVSVQDTGGGIGEIRFYHNGKRIGSGDWTAVKQFQLSADGMRIMDRGLKDHPAAAQSGLFAATHPTHSGVAHGMQQKTFVVPLLVGENIFRATAFSGQMIESEPQEITITHNGAVSPTRLHIIAVGIHNYRAPFAKLPVARIDAEGFVQRLTVSAPRLFGNFNAVNLYDAQATKSAIQEVMAQIAERAKPADTLAFFFAGHGIVLKEDGRFYLVPYGVKHINGQGAESGIANGALSDIDLGKALQKIPAVQQVVFLDACQSGGADLSAIFRQSGEDIAIKRVGRATGTWIFSAAGKTESAYEVSSLGHGLFTQAIIAGIGGDAKTDGTGYKITLSALGDFVVRQVAEYARQLNVNQRPRIQPGRTDFPIAVLP